MGTSSLKPYDSQDESVACKVVLRYIGRKRVIGALLFAFAACRVDNECRTLQLRPNPGASRSAGQILMWTMGDVEVIRATQNRRRRRRRRQHRRRVKRHKTE